jgi:hypothetical protein
LAGAPSFGSPEFQIWCDGLLAIHGGGSQQPASTSTPAPIAAQVIQAVQPPAPIPAPVQASAPVFSAEVLAGINAALLPQATPIAPPPAASRTAGLRAAIDASIRSQGGTPAPAPVTHHPDGRPRSGLALAIDEIVASSSTPATGPSPSRSGLSAAVDEMVGGR